jgi:uncharacterized membrane protein YbhN (UPF0104 family)
MSHQPDRRDDPLSRRAARLRLVGFVLGVILLTAALASVARRGAGLTHVWRALTDAPPTLLAAAAALPLAGLALTGVTFWLLTRRFGKVTFTEMQALIGAAWLLNYLPFWPGMVGRLAYHRAVNHIPITASATVLIWANVLNALAALIVAAATAAASLFFEGDDWRLALAVAAPAPLIALLARFAQRRGDLPDPHLWRLLAVLSVRLVEVQVWAARAAVCFAIAGAPIAWGGVVALAAATQLATLIPVSGNSLGWREWITGLVAPLLPLGLSLTATLDLHTGLTADLINRAIELTLAVPVGLLCAAWVATRVRRVTPP